MDQVRFEHKAYVGTVRRDAIEPVGFVAKAYILSGLDELIVPQFNSIPGLSGVQIG